MLGRLLQRETRFYLEVFLSKTPTLFYKEQFELCLLF